MASSFRKWGSEERPWSPWKFNEIAGYYHRERLDPGGNLEYEYSSSLEPQDEDRSNIIATSATLRQATTTPQRRAHFASDTITYDEPENSRLNTSSRYTSQAYDVDVEGENEDGDDDLDSYQPRGEIGYRSARTTSGFTDLTSQMGRASLSSVPYASGVISSVPNEDDDETESVRGKGGGIQMLAGSSEKSIRISTRQHAYGPSTESPDPNYKVHHSREFKWGRVFKVLWAEPGSQDQFDSVHQVRRFIVIKRMEGHCIALPIVNYTKLKPMKHSKQKSHSMIFTSNEPPNSQEEENSLLKPIRIIPVNRRQKLDPDARLNYAKLYTIEYNVQVWFIGHIHPDSEQQLVVDYNSIHTLLPDRRKPTHHQKKESRNPRSDFSSMDTSMYSPFSNSDGYPQHFQNNLMPQPSSSLDSYSEPYISPQEDYSTSSNIHPSYPSSYKPSSFGQQSPEISEYSTGPQVTSYSGSSRKSNSHKASKKGQHQTSKSNYTSGSRQSHPSSSAFQPGPYDDDLYGEE